MKIQFAFIAFLLVFSMSLGQSQQELSNEVTSEIINNWDNSISKELRGLGFKGGETIVVYVQFKVDEKGQVSILKIKSPHGILNKEVEQIFSSLPKFDPAIINGKPISTTCMLPIKFEVETERQEKKRLKKEVKE